MGLTDSEGTIFDFAGPYTINVSKRTTAFGPPAKVAPMFEYMGGDGGSESRSLWDSGVAAGSEEFRHRMHNLICNNCHDHVAECLNVMRYPVPAWAWAPRWGMISVWLYMLLHGRYTSWSAIVKTYLPALVLWSIILGFMYMPFWLSRTDE